MMICLVCLQLLEKIIADRHGSVLWCYVDEHIGKWMDLRNIFLNEKEETEGHM